MLWPFSRLHGTLDSIRLQIETTAVPSRVNNLELMGKSPQNENASKNVPRRPKNYARMVKSGGKREHVRVMCVSSIEFN